MHGPPMYYTTSSDNARASVEHLAALEPDRVITGDGPAIQGKKMRTGLQARPRFRAVNATRDREIRGPAR